MSFLNLLLNRTITVRYPILPKGTLQTVLVTVKHGWFAKKERFVYDVEAFLNVAHQVCSATEDAPLKVGVKVHEKVAAFIAKHKLQSTLVVPAWAFPAARGLFAHAGKSVFQQVKAVADELASAKAAMLELQMPAEKVEEVIGGAIDTAIGSRTLVESMASFNVPEEKRTLH